MFIAVQFCLEFDHIQNTVIIRINLLLRFEPMYCIFILDGKCPEGFCDSAWESMRYFVEELAKGGGNFYDGWMKNPRSAMISCNDGFRPVSFYIEVME